MITCSSLVFTGVEIRHVVCSAGKSSALELRAVQCRSVQSSSVHCTSLHCTALHCSAVSCNVVYCNVVYCSAVTQSSAHQDFAAVRPEDGGDSGLQRGKGQAGAAAGGRSLERFEVFQVGKNSR